MPGVELTPDQRGRFEHHMKMGMLDALYKQGLLSHLIFIEAVRIQNERDKNFFSDDAGV